MFTEIRFSNFKSFQGAHTVQLSPLTLIYGQNSAGKSALIQLMLLMKQSASVDSSNVPLRFSGPSINLVSFKTVVNGHDLIKPFHFGVTYEDMFHSESREIKLRSLESFDCESHYVNDELVLDKLTYSMPENRSLDATFVRRVENEESPYKYLFSRDEDSHLNIAKNLLSDRIFEFISAQELLEVMSKIDYEMRGFLITPNGITPRNRTKWNGESEIDRDISIDTKYEDAIYNLLNTWEKMHRTRRMTTFSNLNRLQHIGGLREIPDRISFAQPQMEKSVGSRGQNVLDILARSSQTLGKTNNWLRRLGIPYKVDIASLEHDDFPQIGKALALSLTDTRTDTKVSADDIGVGVSQVLPIVVACTTLRNNILAVEQPELHLHPKLQTELADLLIETVKSEKSPQIIAETHSEHLLLRIKKRIREGSLDPSLVKILYVSGENGAKVHEISLDGDGDFINSWPDGFFAERLEEMF